VLLERGALLVDEIEQGKTIGARFIFSQLRAEHKIILALVINLMLTDKLIEGLNFDL
jgi:hypothetical protein